MSIAATSRGGAVHWNGAGLGLVGCDGTRCARVVSNIRNWQVNVRRPPFRDVAYNHLICPGCGKVYTGRGWGVQSAANGTTAGNRDWHAWMVLFGGNEPLTAVAKRRLHELNDQHELRYGRSRLTSHRAVRGGTTACPGPEALAWLAAGAPIPTATTPSGGSIVSWRDQARAWAIKRGITNGDRPRDALERVEAWAMLQAYDEGTPVPSWARPLVEQAERDGTIAAGTGSQVMRRYDWLALRTR